MTICGQKKCCKNLVQVYVIFITLRNSIFVHTIKTVKIGITWYIVHKSEMENERERVLPINFIETNFQAHFSNDMGPFRAHAFYF